jgi:hypothetical protein
MLCSLCKHCTVILDMLQDISERGTTVLISVFATILSLVRPPCLEPHTDLIILSPFFTFLVWSPFFTLLVFVP